MACAGVRTVRQDEKWVQAASWVRGQKPCRGYRTSGFVTAGAGSEARLTPRFLLCDRDFEFVTASELDGALQMDGGEPSIDRALCRKYIPAMANRHGSDRIRLDSDLL